MRANIKGLKDLSGLSTSWGFYNKITILYPLKKNLRIS
jgi:hypothetical protein